MNRPYARKGWSDRFRLRAVVEGIATVLFLPALLVGTYFGVLLVAAATNTPLR